MSLGYRIVTNGTDNHLLLWDVRPTGLNGAKVEKALEMCEISVNKNSVIGDTSAVVPGGGILMIYNKLNFIVVS